MKIILCGACGRMGQVVCETVKEGFCGASLAAAVDITLPTLDCPSYTSLDEVKEQADVLIDFSHHSAAFEIAEFAKKSGVAVVVATTGHTQQELDMIHDAAKKVAVFHSGNMSLGIAVLRQLVKQAVKN